MRIGPFRSVQTESAVSSVRFTAFSKRGRVFALLPDDRAIRNRTIDFLPAHSPIARLYREVSRLSSLAGFRFPGRLLSLIPEGSGAFQNLIIRETGSPTSDFPPLVVLPGNASVPSQRTIVVALDRGGEPRRVLKIGFENYARTLIAEEHRRLREIAALPAAQIPGTGELFESETLSGFGMDFVPGQPPHRRTNLEGRNALLESWIHRDHRVPLAGFASWRRLVQSVVPLSRNAASALDKAGAHHIRAVIHHGDFAPWNIRVDGTGTWRAIDWERGEAAGVPGWDWFHYEIQHAILVRRFSEDKVLSTGSAIIQSEEFQRYCSQTETIKVREMLFLSYLLFNWLVLRQTEGAETAKFLGEWALRQAASCRI